MGGRVDELLFGGVLPTVPGADALAIGGGRILAVGRRQEALRLVSGETRRTDLRGRALLPGFVDAHTHLLDTGLRETGWRVELSGLGREEALSRISREVRRREKGECVVARGWDESLWPGRRSLSREDLDHLAPGSPVVAVRVCGHALVANSLALSHLPSDLNRAEVDLESGILVEEAATAFLLTLEPDDATHIEALLAAAHLCHRLGLTSVHAVVHPCQLRAFMKVRGRLDLRVTVYPEVAGLEALEALGMETGFGDDHLRLGGVKLFADGSIGARTAALREPYADAPHRGNLLKDDAALAELLRRVDEAGLQTAVHAIGDRAIDQVLRAHERAHTSPALRHRIEHFELPDDGAIERAARLGLSACMQPNFVSWSGPGGLYEARLGADRDRRTDPHRDVLDAGLPLAFGSDGMPLSPLVGLHAAVNAPHPGQGVSVEEAIAAYTLGGARLSFEEGEKGTLAVGSLADLVILDEDPRRDPGRIAKRRVEMTFVGGKLVYEREAKG
jgi:hypothetical protein